MEKAELKKLIDVAAGRVPADLIIRGADVVDVFSGTVRKKDIVISGKWIAAVCDPSSAGENGGDPPRAGREEVDASGYTAIPGLIDSHIHIESSYVTPEEIGRLLVPHGTSMIFADPHEIVNVCGLRGLDYMIRASKQTKLDIRFMLPSCVPATPYEHSGSRLDAKDMVVPIRYPEIQGLGEFMDYTGVCSGADGALDKIILAKREGKLIDGHAPGLAGKELDAYASAGIFADHECATADDARERISRGMYVMIREGSACHDLKELMKAVTPENSSRFVLCSDDRQPATILSEGHIDSHLRMLTAGGIDSVTAVRMGTINAAQCFGLSDRGAIAPGRRADITLVNNLKDFQVHRVWIGGELVAEDGRYLPETRRTDISPVRGSIHIGDFSEEKLKMHLKNGHVRTMTICPGGVLTKEEFAEVKIDEEGNFVWDPQQDIAKIAVIERHHDTGNVATALIKGYGIRKGAIAMSIAHDSHNIITVGVSDDEMAAAVFALKEQEGGIVLVGNGQVIERMPMPVAGLMTDQSGEWVDRRLRRIHRTAHEELGVNGDVEPVMTLCFMSLAVIPELKLTDEGLFDVRKFEFTTVER
jgi:adenine deaminase